MLFRAQASRRDSGNERRGGMSDNSRNVSDIARIGAKTKSSVEHQVCNDGDDSYRVTLVYRRHALQLSPGVVGV